MNISRGFMVVASIYIVIGVTIGAYMGGSRNTTLAPIHVHISLLGFTLMMIFGYFYHLFPAAAASALGKAHFWLHQIGTFVMLGMLYLLLSGRIGAEAMVPLTPIAEGAVILGAVCFAINVWNHAR